MAFYDLQDVIAAARKQDIVYPKQSRVANKIEDLEYELKDLSDCMSRLQESDFSKTHYYDKSPPMDAYVVRYQKRRTEDEDFPIDKLYIKFCLINENVVIELFSFHLSEY